MSLEYYRIADIARTYKVTRRTVYNWIDRGVLPPPLKIEGIRLWSAETIQSLPSIPTQNKKGANDD